MSPFSRIVHGSLWSVLGNGVARVFAVATALAAARLLGREGFGTVVLVQLTITTAGTLVSGQLAQAATRFVSQFRESSAAKASAVTRLVTILSAAAGLLAMLVLLLFTDWISRQILRQASLAPLLRLASPAVPCALIAGAQAGILNGYEAFSVAARVNAAGSLAMFLGVLAGGFSAGVDGAVAGWVAGNMVLCLYGYVALRKFRVANPSTSSTPAHFPVSALFSYALPLFSASMVFAVVLLHANALLGQRHSLSDVALYAAADRIHLVLLFVPTAVFTAMFPILSNLQSQGDFSGYRKVLRTVLQITALVLVIPAALMGFFSPTICSMFGAEFRAGGSVLSILCVATIFEALNILFGYLMIIAGRIWLRSCIDIGLALLLGSFATIWIPHLGSLGLAAAYATSFAVAAIALAMSLSVIRRSQRKEIAASALTSIPKSSERSAIPSLLEAIREVNISADPLVSIGMPLRNCEGTIATAIRSIVNQTYEHWELLVIDDGSSDRTLEAVCNFHDPRIRIVQDGTHAGLPARLNQAVKLSRGPYFARMDGDDVSFPERLQRQVAYLESHPEVDLLAASVVVFRGNGVVLGQRVCPAGHEEICRRPWGSFPMPHPTWMGRTEWFRSHPYDPRVVRAEDQELLLRAYRHSRLAGLQEVLLGYREEQLRLGRISRGRINYVKAGLRKFLREHEWGNAMFITLGHGLRMLVDAVAIASGLEHRLLRHRARPVSETLRPRWASVWELNRSDEAAAAFDTRAMCAEAAKGITG